MSDDYLTLRRSYEMICRGVGKSRTLASTGNHIVPVNLP